MRHLLYFVAILLWVASFTAGYFTVESYLRDGGFNNFWTVITAIYTVMLFIGSVGCAMSAEHLNPKHRS